MASDADPSYEHWPALLERGMALHRAGELAAAEQLYRRVLELIPAQPDALNLLGIVAMQTGRVESAISLGRQACALDAKNPSYHLSLGNALRAAQRIAEATDEFTTAIALRPDYAEAHNNLGLSLADKGQHESAIAAFERAAALQPTAAKPFNNLGISLRHVGRLNDSIAACGRAIELDPNLAEAHDNLGLALTEAGRFEQAISAFRRSIALRPRSPIARAHLGTALGRAGRPAEAAESCRAAIAIDSRYAPAHNNLASALLSLDQLDLAIDSLRKAIALNPNAATAAAAYANLCVAQNRAGQYDTAVAAGRTAIRLVPDFAAGHFDLALSLLIRGDLGEGFAEYEWRIRCRPSIAAAPPSNIERWTGQPLAGKTILLQAEQGFGDTIQFIRYAKLLSERGGEVILHCPPLLRSLLGRARGITAIGEAVAKTDFFSPLMSLPHRLGTTLETIPAEIPYISPDPDRVDNWRRIIGNRDNALQAGLVWAGRRSYGNDHRRSMPLAAMQPLFGVPGVRFHSLQIGDAADEIGSVPKFPIIDHSANIRDFADTAALIANLDLVISIDTAVAHLAGAMGKPVWVLLPWIPDWRWMLDRADTPWYPTMRLWRQESDRKWAPVVDAVVGELGRFRKSM